MKIELQKNSISSRCYYAFSELFVMLMHLKVIRAYVDGVLRFGIPPRFYLGLFEPCKGKEKPIIDALTREFSDESMKDFYGSKEEAGDTEDFYPFVMLTLTSPQFLM